MRKVLSFVLVLTLVLSSFSMAFAATTATAGLSDIAGTANEDAIQVANDLGIVTGYEDNTFLPDKAVTRAEFAAMITRALAIPESALAGYSSTTFKDTSGYGWAVPYLAFCQSKGIMLGDGAGNVMPGRTINTNEAMTMMLRALGYTSNSAALVGTWPSNYVTLAQEQELYDDVTATGDVNRANAAQIIYNALTVEKVEVATDGTTDGTGTTLIEAGLNCDSQEGIIGGDITNDGVINLQQYQGVYGTAYINDDDDIVAFDASGTSVEGDWTTDGSYVFDGYLDGDKEYEFAASIDQYDSDDAMTAGSIVYYFENGIDAGTISVGGLNADGTYTFNADISGKTINELYSIAGWDSTADDMVEADDIASIDDDQELLGYDFTLDDDDAIDLTEFDLVGVASLDKIAEDNVVYVYADADDDEIQRIAVGTEQVTGTITKKTSDSIYVGGTEYEWASDNSTDVEGATTDRPDAGDDVTLYLDAYGDIYDYDVNDSTPDTYGIVKAYYPNTATIQLKLFNSEGNSKTYDVDDDVDITTGQAISDPDIEDVDVIADAALVGYSIDDDGVIDSLDGTATTDAGTWILKSESVLSKDGTTYPIADDCVFFSFDGDDDYDVISIDDFDLDTQLTLDNDTVSVSAIIDEDDGVVALLVDAANATGGSDDAYAVANDFDEAYDATLDDTVFNFVGFADAAAIDKNTNDDSVTDEPVTDDGTVKLYALSYDSDGYISDISEVDAATSGAIYDITSDKQTVQLNTSSGAWVQIADNAVVYQIADFDDDQEYKVSSVSSLKATSTSTTYTVYFYETDDDESGYDVVIWYKQ